MIAKYFYLDQVCLWHVDLKKPSLKRHPSLEKICRVLTPSLCSPVKCRVWWHMLIIPLQASGDRQPLGLPIGQLN